MTARVVIEIFLLVITLTVMGLGLYSEFAPQFFAWQVRRRGLVDSGQSDRVRVETAKLASPDRDVRLDGVEWLRKMRDRSAVPALINAARLYDADAQLLEAIVRALHTLGDERAVPTLRRVARGRNLSLMEAAKSALRDLAPKSDLLRAATEPASASELLRPSGADKGRGKGLLRPRGEE